MYINPVLLVIAIFIVFFLGWFARSYMQRSNPHELAKWDADGMDAKKALAEALASAAANAKAEYVKATKKV